MGFRNETHLFLFCFLRAKEFTRYHSIIFRLLISVITIVIRLFFLIYSRGFLRDVEKILTFCPLWTCIFKKL